MVVQCAIICSLGPALHQDNTLTQKELQWPIHKRRCHHSLSASLDLYITFFTIMPSFGHPHSQLRSMKLISLFLKRFWRLSITAFPSWCSGKRPSLQQVRHSYPSHPPICNTSCIPLLWSLTERIFLPADGKMGKVNISRPTGISMYRVQEADLPTLQFPSFKARAELELKNWHFWNNYFPLIEYCIEIFLKWNLFIFCSSTLNEDLNVIQNETEEEKADYYQKFKNSQDP